MPYFPPPFSISSANPSVTVGLTAKNGTASTFMTSDSAPALDQTAAFAFNNLSTTIIKGLLTVAPTSNAVAPVVLNAATGFVGLLLDAQLANTSYFRVSAVNTSGATTGQLFLNAPAGTAQTQLIRFNSGGTANGPGLGINTNGSGGLTSFGNGSTVYSDLSSSGLNISPAIPIGWTSSTANVTNALPDAFWGRGGAGSIIQGGAASGTPVNQTYSAQSGTGTNIAGAKFSINPGAGTGNAAPNPLQLNSYVAVASGTGGQTLTNTLTLNGGLLQFNQYTTAGLLQNDASGNVTTNTAVNASTIPANFIAADRLTIVIAGVTYYIPLATIAF